MTKELHELLSSDIYTDDIEYAERVARIREIIAHTTFASPALVEATRKRYAKGAGVDDIEVDEDAPTSRADEGTFVQGWLWVPNSENPEIPEEEDSAF